MKRLLKIVLSVIGKGGIARYVVLGLLSGMSSFLFINNVTRVIGLIISGKFTAVSREYIILFLSIILLFVWARRKLALLSISVTQKIAWLLRKQILSLALNANYQQLASRKPKIQSAILSDVGALTNASMGSIDFFIQLIMATSCLAYMASISLVLFSLTIVVAAIGVTLYYFTTKRNMKGFEKARKIENVFQENLNSLLNGFKEIFMERKKGVYIYEQKICANANTSYNHNVSTLTRLINNQVTGQILFYILITSILLVFSVILKISSQDIVSFIFTLLYLLGSIEAIMLLLPTLMRAGVASNHLMDLKKDLEQADFKPPVSPGEVFTGHFSRITVRNLQFRYGDEATAFGVGPVNFTIQKGEVIFIYGGNGSGKTTFMNAVLGLYAPQSAEISVNGELVNEDNNAGYRRLFAVVFNDFYLFNELMAIDHFDQALWDRYIRLFELEGKVTIENNIFSTTELSAGQRKRLALIVALMEKKPVLVLDEWAADQDPYFRKKFYTEIIPLLKREGLSVVAITHDDKYYHYADRLFKMDEGNLVEESPQLHQHVFMNGSPAPSVA